MEHVTEGIENVLGHGQGGSGIVHIGTSNNDMEGTTRIVQKCRVLVGKRKEIRVAQIILSGSYARGCQSTLQLCTYVKKTELNSNICEDILLGKNICT